MTGLVRTVLGDVPATELGPTYCHEHLLARPPAHVVGESLDLVLDDEERAAAEVASFRDAGGGGLVDVTTREWGRDPEGLRRLSKRTGAHVLATTGHLSEEVWRGVLPLERIAEPALVDELVRELTEGIDGTGVRAGVIKAGSSHGRVTADERRLFRAAAAAQQATGAAITTHTTAGTAALEQVDVLEKAGARLGHVCIGHVDRRLDWDEHVELARRGVFLGYDCVSKEQYHPDSERARFIVRLSENGFGDRICLSGDLARRSYLEAWGGRPGYRYILDRFLPLLRAAGLGEAETRRLVVDNAARLLAWT
jgi:phosphotriesterase-related protein